MSEISVGAVGAAIIAGLVSLLGLIIGKEQKVSEFRQAWIDDLRQCLVDYLVYINAVSDALRLKKAGEAFDSEALLENYKRLNQASHGITLRINESEFTAQELVNSMSKFEALADVNADLTPSNIRSLEDEFVKAAKALLKFEWKRVKKGENVYVWTKRTIVIALVAMLVLLGVIMTSSTTDSSDAQRSGVEAGASAGRVATPKEDTKPLLIPNSSKDAGRKDVLTISNVVNQAATE